MEIHTSFHSFWTKQKNVEVSLNGICVLLLCIGPTNIHHFLRFHFFFFLTFCFLKININIFIITVRTESCHSNYFADTPISVMALEVLSMQGAHRCDSSLLQSTFASGVGIIMMTDVRRCNVILYPQYFFYNRDTLIIRVLKRKINSR